MQGKRLTWYFVEAAAGGITASLNELFACPDLPNVDDDPLATIEALCREAEDHGVTLTPHPTGVKDFATEIVLARQSENDAHVVGERIKTQYLGGEIPDVEYKSTLWLDVDRRAAQPDANIADLRANKMANSSMKTICGFLNEEGGTLIIGIKNDCTIFGLENEFEVACNADQTLDGWLQVLRATVEQFFHDAKDVWNHLRVEIGEIDGKSVCLITAIPRKKLSCCKCKDARDFQVYSRKGTSTDSVAITIIEDYVINRSRRIGII